MSRFATIKFVMLSPRNSAATPRPACQGTRALRVLVLSKDRRLINLADCFCHPKLGSFRAVLVLILTLAYTAVTAKAIAVYYIYKAHGTRFPAICLSLIFSLARTATVVTLPFAPRQAFYSVSAPLDLMFSAWAVFEVFQAVTVNHFPVRRWGSRFLGCFTAAGVLVSFLVRFVWVPATWNGLQLTVAAECLSVFVMVVVLSLTWLFLNVTSRIPESPAASTAVAIMLFHGICSTAIAGLSASTGMKSWWIVSVAPAANGLVVGILWAAFFSCASSESAAEEPIARRDIREIESLEDELFSDLKVRHLAPTE